MPSTKTITSSDVVTVAARGKIKSADWNSTISLFRGHLLPITTNTSTASDLTYDLGDYSYSWANSFHQVAVMNDLAAAPANPTAGFYKLYFKTDGNLYKLNTSGTETQVDQAAGTNPDQSYELNNLGIAASVASSALTIALKVKDGGTDPSAGSPVKIGFRNATAATGAYVQRSVTGALSVVVSSGSTLGHSSANAHWIYVYAIDNAGTVELGVSSVIYDEGTVLTTVAEGGAGAADGRSVYTTTARTGVAIRLIGRMKSTQATAGTWASTMTEISVMPFRLPKLVCIYETNTADTFVNNTEETVEFEDKTFDNYNAYNATTGEFTAPFAGIFQVSFTVEFEQYASWASGERVLTKILKNGANAQVNRFFYAGDLLAHADVTGVVQLAAADVVKINMEQSSGANLALSTTSAANRMSIIEIERT